MMVAIAALAAVALLAADVAGVVALRSYLIGKLDSQLQVGAGPGGPPPRFVDDSARRGGFNPGPANHLYFYTADGQRVDAAFDTLKAHADGGPFTVEAGGQSWRVAVRTVPAGEYLPGGGYVVVAISLSDVEDTQAKLLAESFTVRSRSHSCSASPCSQGSFSQNS